MTCIVGIAQEGKVHMMGDSMASSGYNRRVTALHKVFKRGQFVIGYTTSFRMGQLLQYSLDVPLQQEWETDEGFMVGKFVESVRDLLKTKGFASVQSNTENGGQFLVGYRGCLYEIGGDYQVNHWIDGIASVGAGEDLAMAAMLALPDWRPEDRLRRALEITSQLSVYVIPPYVYEVLGE